MSTATSDDLSIGTGAGVGAGAWVAGLVLTVIVGMAGLNSFVELAVRADIINGTLSSYVFFHSWFYGTGMTGGLEVFTILPILVLIGAGYYVASQENNGYMAAAGVTAGYFVLALISVVLVLVLSSGSPDLVDTIIRLIVAGIVFPAVFAGIGGAIAEAV